MSLITWGTVKSEDGKWAVDMELNTIGNGYTDAAMNLEFIYAIKNGQLQKITHTVLNFNQVQMSTEPINIPGINFVQVDLDGQGPKDNRTIALDDEGRVYSDRVIGSDPFAPQTPQYPVELTWFRERGIKGQLVAVYAGLFAVLGVDNTGVSRLYYWGYDFANAANRNVDSKLIQQGRRMINQPMIKELTVNIANKMQLRDWIGYKPGEPGDGGLIYGDAIVDSFFDNNGQILTRGSGGWSPPGLPPYDSMVVINNTTTSLGRYMALVSMNTFY